eukprot:Opistho-2@63232
MQSQDNPKKSAIVAIANVVDVSGNRRPVSVVVFDEMHNVKSPTAEQTRNVRALLEQCPEAKILGLSGTPVINEVAEGWSILNIFDVDKPTEQPTFGKPADKEEGCDVDMPDATVPDIKTKPVAKRASGRSAYGSISEQVKLHRYFATLPSVRQDVEYPCVLTPDDRDVVVTEEELVKYGDGPPAATEGNKGKITAEAGNQLLMRMELGLTRCRLKEIQAVVRENCSKTPPQKTLVYSEYIGGIDSVNREESEILRLLMNGIRNAFGANGRKVAVGAYTGQQFHVTDENKIELRSDMLDKFKSEEDGCLEVLVGSKAISTGIDDLQYVCNTLVFNSLPMTSADYDQVIGRLYRRGQTKDEVRVVRPLVKLKRAGDGKEYSSCLTAVYRINRKKALQNLVLDGIFPPLCKTTREEAEMSTSKMLLFWFKRASLESNRAGDVAAAPVPAVPQGEDAMETDGDNGERVGHTRANRTDFRTLNRQWNGFSSADLHAALQRNRQEWEYYHDLLESRKLKWTITPTKQIARMLLKRLAFAVKDEGGIDKFGGPAVIGDFGCGREGHLFQEFTRLEFRVDGDRPFVGTGMDLIDRKLVTWYSVDHQAANKDESGARRNGGGGGHGGHRIAHPCQHQV